MKKKKFGKLDFKKFHPAGNLGNKLKTAGDVMLVKSKIPFVPENEIMKKALKILNDKTSKADIYDTKQSKWVKRDKKDTLNTLVEKGYGILDNEFESQKNNNKIENNILKKYIDFQNKYDKGDKKLEKQLEKDIRDILTNYKEHCK